MFPILHIGPVAIQVPGLLLLAGVWMAVNLIEKDAGRRKLSAEGVSTMVLIALLMGVLGARLWYAIRFLDVYIENPLSLFSLNPATLATVEGVLTGVLAGAIYGERKKLPLWPTLDALAPGFAVMAIAVAFAHLASGDAFGEPSNVPWAIELWGEMRHPSQMYEIIAAALIYLALRRIQLVESFPGFAFLAWLAMTAAAQLFLGAFRGDSVIIFAALRREQVFGLTVMLGAMAGMYVLGRREEERRKDKVEGSPSSSVGAKHSADKSVQ